MKQQYDSPVMDVVEFETEDVITTSKGGLPIEPTNPTNTP